MNRTASLYAVIGGVVGAVLTMAVCAVMPIGAQNGDATFGEITCTGLNVVSAKGKTKVSLMPLADTGMVWVFGRAGDGVTLYVDDHGGQVEVLGKGIDKTRAGMCVNEYGDGVVYTWDKKAIAWQR